MSQQAAGTPDPSEQGSSPTRIDLVSVLYVVGGIPAMVGFLVLLFVVGVRFCGAPA